MVGSSGRNVCTTTPRQHPPPGPAGDLGDQLKGPLAGAKIGQRQAVSPLMTPTSVTLG